MSFTGALGKSLTNPATFKGRASRHEFICFFIFYMWIWLLMLALLVSVPVMAPVFFLIALTSVLPMLSVTVRRLHDIDRSAYWILLSFVPIVGSYALSVMLVWPGTPGHNTYGPEPALVPA